MVGLMSELIRYRRLVKAIREIMDTNSWNQTSMAKAFGTKQPVVSAWVTGASFPDEVLRRKLAKCRGLTLEQFDAWLEGESVEERALPHTVEEALPLLVNLDWAERVQLIKKLLDESV